MEPPKQSDAVVKQFVLLERTMGIEPTSEAWEACSRPHKTHKLAAI